MIFVTGGTGTVGRSLLRGLAATGTPARVLCRSRDKAREVAEQGLETVLGHFDDVAGIQESLAGCDTLFLLVGPRPDQADVECRLVDAAAAAGVPRVVAISSADAHPDSPVPWARWHGVSDAYLRESGLVWTLLKPTAFMQNFLSWAPMIAMGMVAGVSGSGRVPWIDTVDVGEVAARVLTTEGHNHTTYFLTGPELLSAPDGVDRIAKVLGRPVTYRDVPTDVYRQQLARHMPDWMADGLVEQYHSVLRNGHVPDVTYEVGNILGRKPRSFDDFLAANNGAFSEN